MNCSDCQIGQGRSCHCQPTGTGIVIGVVAGLTLWGVAVMLWLA